jgi:hypothetical protein
MASPPATPTGSVSPPASPTGTSSFSGNNS